MVCIKKFIRRITNFVSYIGHLRVEFLLLWYFFQALSGILDLVFIERRSKMLNKVKTKALISVGAVDATSFILWILHDKKNKEIKRKIKVFVYRQSSQFGFLK